MRTMEVDDNVDMIRIPLFSALDTIREVSSLQGGNNIIYLVGTTDAI